MTGNICGSVDLYELSIKKLKLKGKFEVDFINQSRIKIFNMESKRSSVVGSRYNAEILNVKIQSDNYVVAITSRSIIIGSIRGGEQTEIDWNGSGNERFSFMGNICLISNAGEVTIIEIGNQSSLGNFRTQYFNQVTCMINK